MDRSTSPIASYRVGASTAVIAWALSMAAPAAMAQQTAQADSDNKLEEIVVTGFRSSLAKAIDLKRDEDSQFDAILAEDIGKFPDLNLSESIQRIAGVAITRDGGEGRQISVRGLGPQFTRIRINGMEALTTAGGTDATGGTNRGRSFDFNIFASDLFNSIGVRKTAEATTEEGSLGATVDLQTARPFDYDGFRFAASAQGGYNDLSEKFNPRTSALVSNTWHDGDFGALLSASYTKRKILDNGTSTVRWATGNAFAPGFASAPAGTTLAAVNAAYHPRFPRFDQYKAEQERLGLTASVQWRPTDKTLVTVDGLYADFDGTREEQFLEAPSFSVGGACTAANISTTCGIANTAVTAATIDSSNTLVAGTFNNVDLRVEDRFDVLETKFTQLNIQAEHEFSDMLKGHIIAGTSKSDHDNPIQTTVTLDQFNVQGYSYDYSKGRVPLISYGNAQLTNPAAWTLTSIRLRPQTALNEYDTLKGGFELKPNDIFKFNAGVDWKKYNFETTEQRRSIGTTTNQESVIPAALAAIPVANYSKVINFKIKGLGAPAGNVTAWLVPNLDVAQNVLSFYDQTAYNGAFRLGREPALTNNNQVGEKDFGGYVQGSFVTEVGDGMTLRGNAGVRYVETKQSTRGFAFVGGSTNEISVERKYDDWLPSANLVFEPIDEFIIRGSAARVMARPNLGNLPPGATVSVSGSTRTVSAGNPNLDPFRANAYDLSFEWYPETGTILSLALFKKDIINFVQTLSTSGTFSSNPFGLPDSVAIAACGNVPGCSPSSQWNFSAPFNTPGGNLKGYEVSYQQPFKFLPGLLANTGVLLNYTRVKSSIDYYNASAVVIATTDLTGLSRKSYNTTLYYEDELWSARVSAAYRSKYFTRIPGQEAGTDKDGTNSTFNVDASIQYSWNDNLKFTLEGVNLTDEYSDQFNDSANRLTFRHHTGREFLLGVRYTY